MKIAINCRKHIISKFTYDIHGMSSTDPYNM